MNVLEYVEVALIEPNGKVYHLIVNETDKEKVDQVLKGLDVKQYFVKDIEAILSNHGYTVTVKEV